MPSFVSFRLFSGPSACFQHPSVKTKRNLREKTIVTLAKRPLFVVDHNMSTVDPFETVKRLTLERRSVRKYLDKEIPIDELKEVLALAQV